VIRISLHAGVSRGVAGRLHSPAVDARDLAAAAAARGFGVQRVLIDPTAAEFLAELRLGPTLITFSGHGRPGSWCFADRDLALTEVIALLPSAVEVCIVSDACHSRDAAWPPNVTLLAPAEPLALDGCGKNTRSPFTAAVIREWLGTPPARACGGTSVRRTR
jgi:hypothetical protein